MGEIPSSMAGWQALLDAPDEFVRQAARAGLMGRKAELLEMLCLVHEVGLPPALRPVGLQHQIKVGELTAMRRFFGVASADLTVESADLQSSVVWALTFDQPGTEVESMTLLLQWDCDQGLRRNRQGLLCGSRTHWSALDEALVQAAISLWRPGGPLAFGQDNEQGLARFMALVARHLDHDEPIRAFERAGVDPDLFHGWTVGARSCDDLGQDTGWDVSTPHSSRVPLTVLMILRNNLMSAAEVLNHGATPAAREMARRLIEHIASSSELLKSLSPVFHQHPSLGLGHQVLRLMESLNQLHGESITQVAWLKVLKTAIACTDDMGYPFDKEFSRRVLACAQFDMTNGGRQSPALTGSHARLRSSAVVDLLVAALNGHRLEVLEAAKPLLEQVARHGSVLGGQLTRERVLIEAARLPQRKLFLADDCRRTLGLLQETGFDLRAPIVTLLDRRGRRSVSSLLHNLACSRHPCRVDAMAVALEAGARPEIHDSQRKTPHALLDNEADKIRWRDLVASHHARAAADSALNDLEGQP